MQPASTPRLASTRIVLSLAALVTAVVISLPALAQNNRSNAQPIPEPPPPPPGFELDPAAEPQVTVRKRGEDTVEEYRIAGKLYMMKVTPAGGGPSYYLVDDRGDGQFARKDGPSTGVRPPMWVIHSW